MSTDLLDRETIERALAEAQDTPILIALSGGGDSVALLHLLVEELGVARLRACVVDHGLRSEASLEAACAQSWANELGVGCWIEKLLWRKAPSGQSATRAARYAALSAAARSFGARFIALAHTADDQAETVFMRAGAGSTWRGLAGMAPLAPAPLWPDGRGVKLARPLLKARRSALRDFLRSRGAEWIEDPSNANTVYARVRTRLRLAELEGEGVDPMRLTRLAESFAPHVAALDANATALIRDVVRFDAGVAEIALARWRESDEARRRALGVLIAAVSGEDAESAPRGLAEIEAQMSKPDFTGATLGGARLRPVRDGVRLERDRGAVLGRADGKEPLPPLPLTPGQESVWDGRLALTALSPGWTVTHDDTAAPILVNGDQAFGLAEAEATGIVQFQWLLQAHVAHLLAAFRE